jgi:hypothetical protein
MANRPRILKSLKRPSQELKRAVAVLLAEFSSVAEAANCCRARPSTLSGYANINQDGSAPVDVVLALERRIGKPVVTKFVAAQLGYELIRLPVARDGDPLGHRIRRIISSGSKVFAATADALEDGKITPDEADKLLVDVAQAITAFVDLSKGLEAVVVSKKSRAMARVSTF